MELQTIFMEKPCCLSIKIFKRGSDVILKALWMVEVMVLDTESSTQALICYVIDKFTPRVVN